MTVAKVGVFVAEGNNRNFGNVVFPMRDGKAYAVDGDRALWDDIFCDFGRYIHGIAPAVAFRLERRDRARAIHVAENKVSAELFAGGERLFEVHAVAFCEPGERSLVQRFHGQIGRKGFLVSRNHGKAAAVDGNAAGDRKRLGKCWRANLQAAAVGVNRERFDCAEMFDDARKQVWSPTNKIADSYVEIKLTAEMPEANLTENV